MAVIGSIDAMDTAAERLTIRVKVALVHSGVATINEVRATLGLRPVSHGGDVARPRE